MLTVDNGMGMDEQAAEQGRSSGGSDAPQGLQWGTGPGPAPASPTKKKSLSGAKAAKEAQVSIAAGFSWGTCNIDHIEQQKAECHSGNMMQCCQSACLSCLMQCSREFLAAATVPECCNTQCIQQAHNAHIKRAMHALSLVCTHCTESCKPPPARSTICGLTLHEI